MYIGGMIHGVQSSTVYLQLGININILNIYTYTYILKRLLTLNRIKNMITKDMFDNAIKAFDNDTNGVVSYPVKRLNDGRDLCLVFGWVDGYGDGNEDYQRDGYTLCCKLAINIDDLQCDYDIDWYMPWDKKGNVYDTDMALTKDYDDTDWYNQQANIIADMLNAGQLECK